MKHMKKLLLITFLFLITPDAKADMDYTCEMEFSSQISDYIKENCERNNILILDRVPRLSLIDTIAYWCRKDREINYYLIPEPILDFNLTCVLYDNKPRKPIQIK